MQAGLEKPVPDFFSTIILAGCIAASWQGFAADKLVSAVPFRYGSLSSA
jgi:hypothetical protein